MNVGDLAAKYGISEPEMRDVCATLGVAVSAEGELDESAFREAMANRNALRAQPPAEAPMEPPVAVPTEAVPTEAASPRTLRATPALVAGAALAAAFFMPLVSGFGGLLTISSWGYVRLSFDFRDQFDAGDWAVLVFLGLVGVLAVAVVATEALGKRSRVLLLAAAADVFGLVIYIAIKAGSLDGFRHADIAGYVAVAAALVLVLTGLGVLDREAAAPRKAVYAACALLVAAGIAVPATTSSFKSDVNDVFDGIQSNLDNASSDDSAPIVDDTIPTYEIEHAVEAQLSDEHNLDALVSCDNELDRKVGASEVCVFETFDSDATYDVTVTVRSLSGEDVRYDVEPSSTAH